MSSGKPIRRAPYYLHDRRHSRITPTVTRTADKDLEAVIASADLPKDVMQDLLGHLKISNEAGEMLTFNTVTEDWDPWFQYVYSSVFVFQNVFWSIRACSPLRPFKSSRAPAPVAPSGLKKIPNLRRPLCPHAANDLRPSGYGIMYERKRTLNGVESWIFQARHNCPFIGTVSHLTFITLYLCTFLYQCISLQYSHPSRNTLFQQRKRLHMKVRDLWGLNMQFAYIPMIP